MLKRLISIILLSFNLLLVKSKEYYTLHQLSEVDGAPGVTTSITEHISRLNLRNTDTGLLLKNVITGTITLEVDLGAQVTQIHPVYPSDYTDISSKLVAYVVTTQSFFRLELTPDSQLKDYSVLKVELAKLEQPGLIAAIKGSNRLAVASLQDHESKLYRIDYSNKTELEEVNLFYKGKASSLESITHTTMVIFTTSVDGFVYLVNMASLEISNRLLNPAFLEVDYAVYVEFSPERNLIIARNKKHAIGMDFVEGNTHFVLEFENEISIIKPINGTKYVSFVVGLNMMKFVDIEAPFHPDVNGKSLISYSPDFSSNFTDPILYLSSSDFQGRLQWILSTGKTTDLIADSYIYCRKGCTSCTVKLSPISCSDCATGFTLRNGLCEEDEPQRTAGFVENWDNVNWVYQEKKTLFDAIFQNKPLVLLIFIIFSVVITAGMMILSHVRLMKKLAKVKNEKGNMRKLTKKGGKYQKGNRAKGGKGFYQEAQDLVDSENYNVSSKRNKEEDKRKKLIPDDGDRSSRRQQRMSLKKRMTVKKSDDQAKI